MTLLTLDRARRSASLLLGQSALDDDLADHSWFARSWVTLLALQLSGGGDSSRNAPPDSGSIGTVLGLAAIRGASADPLFVRSDGPFAEIGAASRGTAFTRLMWLETVEPRHAEALYSMAVRSASLTRWRYRGHAPTPSEFQSSLFSENVVQVVAYHGEPVAHLVGYDLDLQAGSCKVGVVGTGGAAPGTVAGLVLFLRFLFSTWPLDRVIFEIPDYNAWLVEPLPPVLSNLGRIADSTYWNGSLHGVRDAAIERDAFSAGWRAWVGREP